MEFNEYVTIDDLDVQSDIIKTGNGNCGYIILPKNLCGCNPGKYGELSDAGHGAEPLHRL